MLKRTLSLIALVPAALAAQVGAGASAKTQTQADAQLGKSATAGVATSASVDAELSAARANGTPERPIQRRVAEGRAKGASEAQVAASARRLRLTLESAHEAMVSVGRAKPSDEEVERGAYVLERGYTRAQLEAVAKSAPADRSLVVAFDVLARLNARGVSVANAVSQVQSRLAARASDASIDALVDANANVGAAGANAGGAVGAAGKATVGAAATGVKGATSVTGAVGGVLKKP